MTLPSENHRSGFTLLEVLIALAVLSLVAGLVFASQDGPSPQLRLQAQVSELIESASAHRLQSVRSARPIQWVPDVKDCEGAEITAVFLPDGTTADATFCLSHERHSIELRLDAMSGRARVETK